MNPTTDAPSPEAASRPTEPSEHAAARIPFRLQLLAIAAIALALRSIHLFQLRSNPLFGWLVGDPQRYHAWASAIASGDWLGDGVFFQAPLYPYFLGVLYWILGADPAWARLAQIALGVGSCVLVAAATRRLAGPRAGLAAGLLLALYPPTLFFEVVLQKSALDVFLLSLLLLLVLRAWDGGSGSWLAVGLAGGAFVLTRENAAVLLVGLAVWRLVDRRHRGGASGAAAAAALAIGAALVLAPVALRNLAVGGQLVVSSSQLGRNLYYGNGPEATGTYVPLIRGRGAIRWEDADARRIAEEALGRPLRPSEVSSYWTERTMDHVRAHPGRWLRLLVRKARWTVASLEMMDTEDQYTYREWAPIAKALGSILHFGVLFPLAVLGGFAAPRGAARGPAGLLTLWVVLYAASVVAFFVLDRYRLPLAVLLVPFASIGLTRSGAWLRRAGRFERGAAAVAVVTAALLSNWPVRPIEPMRAQTLNNLGASLAGSPATLGLAAVALEQALELRPNLGSAHHNLGVLRERSGRPAEALASFERAVEHGYETATTRRHQGFNLATLRRWDEAAMAYGRAVALDPTDVPVIVRWGIVLAEAGDLEAAAGAFEQALAVDPGNRAARENLERARSLLADREGAPPAEG